MTLFKNLNAMPKLMLGSGILLVVTVAIGYEGVRMASQLSGQIDILYDQDVSGIEAIKQAEVDKALIARCTRNAIIEADNKPAVEAALKDFQMLFADLKRSLDVAFSTAIRENYRASIRAARDLLPAYEKHAEGIFQLALSGDAAGSRAALKSASGDIALLNEAVRNAVRIKKDNIETFKQETRQSFLAARGHLWLSVVLAIGLGLCVSFVNARQFSIPLQLAAEVLQHVAKGDLTRTLAVDTTNEIGNLAKALNLAISNMRDVLTQVGESSSNLTSASVQLAKAADGLAGGSQEQAASLEETSASLEEITATVRQNSDNALQASQFALSSRDAAEKGGGVVSNAVSAMSEINAASSKIAAIIGAIDEIAFQTNLLAVNASVEAARAGEHGRGFAVVATEVRNLAQRSAGAAKEIKSLISDSVRKVENGSVLVTNSGKTLSEIVAAVKRVTDIVGEIAAASREQSAGIEQVNSAMLQMDRVMQSNSSQTEQLSATANNVAAQAAHLEQLVARFVVRNDPHNTTKNPSEKPASSPAMVTPLKTHSLSPATAATSPSLAGLSKLVGTSVHPTGLDEEFEEF